MDKTELIDRLKEIQIIVNKPVTLRSGQVSDFYCDVKKAFGYPDILNAVAEELVKLLPKEVTCIAASGYGGLPFGALVAAKANKKFSAVRDNAKDHGTKQKIDGYVPTQEDILAIIDDVLTTGSSIKSTLSALSEINAKVICAIVVVKRTDIVLDIPCVNIFVPDDLK